MKNFQLFSVFFILLGTFLWAEEPSRVWRTKSGGKATAVWDVDHDGGGEIRLTLTKGFWLLESEVTQQVWQSVMGEERGSDYLGKEPQLPVYGVNWNDCSDFCGKLSELTHEQIQLPTEAQWEYACRAGTTGNFDGSDRLADIAWYSENSGRRVREVRLKKPNGWGLYDMHGNVTEWCSDWMGEYDLEELTDPRGAVGGWEKVSRGGSYSSNASECRSASRRSFATQDGYPELGFRPALIPAGD